MQISDFPCGVQRLVHGNIVNVAVDIEPSVNILPRSMNNTNSRDEKHTHNVNLRNIYDQWLYGKMYIYAIQNSDLYKDTNVQVETYG